MTKPDSQAIIELGRVTNAGSDKLSTDIRQLTNKLIELKQDVRWFDGFLGSSLVIANPDKQNGWVRIESLLPILEPKFRPSIKIFRKRNEQRFLRYKNLYEEIWKAKSENATKSNIR